MQGGPLRDQRRTKKRQPKDQLRLRSSRAGKTERAVRRGTGRPLTLGIDEAVIGRSDLNTTMSPVWPPKDLATVPIL